MSNWNEVKFIFLFCLLFYHFNGFGANMIKVRLNPTMPLDPIKIKKMDDYDLGLCLYQTWFNYDDARNAVPGLIESWVFDAQKGGYLFNIKKNSRWSNGSAITAGDFLGNLHRIITTKTSYAKIISNLVDVKNSYQIDNTSFFVKIVNGMPNKEFFQRMGSMFLALIPPKELSSTMPDLFLQSNKIVNGPYVIKNQSKNEIILEKNKFFHHDNLRSPDQVIIRIGSATPSLDDFLDGKSWENMVRLNTLLPTSIITKMRNKKLPFWTRGFDRVSLLKPMRHDLVLRDILKLAGNLWQTENFSENTSGAWINIQKANSLQPLGYPLHEELDYQNTKQTLVKANRRLPFAIKILSFNSYELEFQKPLLDNLFSQLQIKVEWVIKSKSEAITLEMQGKGADYSLFSFGVADPEAPTWLGLVLAKDFPMIETTGQDLKSFNQILGSQDETTAKLRNLLSTIGNRGSYLPLFHFSTFAIGHAGLDFSAIRELDETVDFSKIIIR